MGGGPSGHDDVDDGATLHEFAAEIDRLVSGDPARDAQDDMGTLESHGQLLFRS